MPKARRAMTADHLLADARRLGRTGDPARALALAEHVAGTALDTQQRARALQRAAWHHAQLGEADPGLSSIVEARRLWQELDRGDEVAACTSLYGWLLLEAGLTDEAFAEAEAALLLPAPPMTRAHALNTKAAALLYSAQPQLAQPLLQEAIALAGAAADHSSQSLFLTDLAFALAEQGDEAKLRNDMAEFEHFYALAADTGLEALDAANACADGWMARLAICNTAEYLGVAGRLREAWDLLQRWPATQGRPGGRETVHHLYTSGELHLRSGDRAAARAACTEALELAEASGHTNNQMNCTRRLAEIAEAQRDFEAALGWFRRFHDLYRRNEGETIKRRAEAAEIRFQSERFRAEAARLADEVRRDPLTGIANRRAFEERRRNLAGQPVAIAIIDIDRFKAINDGYSHIMGDRVLRAVAELIDAGTGPGAFAARLGGEEFGLLLTGAAVHQHQQACEALRRQIAEHDWHSFAPDLAVTASIGVATGAADDDALLELADQRLYAAKSGGRNRVVGMLAPAA